MVISTSIWRRMSPLQVSASLQALVHGAARWPNLGVTTWMASPCLSVSCLMLRFKVCTTGAVRSTAHWSWFWKMLDPGWDLCSPLAASQSSVSARHRCLWQVSTRRWNDNFEGDTLTWQSGLNSLFMSLLKMTLPIHGHQASNPQT